MVVQLLPQHSKMMQPGSETMPLTKLNLALLCLVQKDTLKSTCLLCHYKIETTTYMLWHVITLKFLIYKSFNLREIYIIISSSINIVI